MQLHFW
jgi:hypothetical protein